MNEGTPKKMLFTVKARFLLISILPATIIGISMLIAGITFMKSGMEEEILKGLLSSAYSYRDTGIANMDREPGDSAIESELKKNTGFDFTWFDGDTRKNSSLGESVIGTKAVDTVIKEVIGNKKQFTSTKTQVANKDYFVAYVPVTDDSGKVIAMAFTGVSRESVNAKINKSVSVMVLIGFALILITVITSIRSSNSMSSAIRCIETSITNLSQGNFIKADKHLDRSDEIGFALNSTNNLVDKLAEVIAEIRKASNSVNTHSRGLANTSNQISNTADNVSTAVQQMAIGATEQAETIQDATENISDLSDAIQTVSLNAEKLANTANNMNNASHSSMKSLENLSENMIQMGESVESVTRIMNDTNTAVQNVNKKVDGISGIAFQTNLLALNASIEAARAGESGKGFVVVAEEIGKLATESATTANEIKNEMANLLKQSADALKNADDISNINKNVDEVLQDTVSKINDLIQNVNSTVDDVTHISSLTEECDKSKVVIVDAMSSLSAISQENAASTEETSASMTDLNETVNNLASSANDLQQISEQLDKNLEFFNI